MYYSLLSQVSYPVFLACVFVFFIIISVFSFIVGISLVTRNPRMLRFFEFMNRSYSTRRLMKPLMQPRYVEPVLFKYPRVLGTIIVAGALISLYVLHDIHAEAFAPVYAGTFDAVTAEILSGYTHNFLVWGNLLCIPLGVMMLFYQRYISLIERYADKWYSFRKPTRPLYVKRFEVDRWVLAHSTVSGVALSALSLLLGLMMYLRL